MNSKIFTLLIIVAIINVNSLHSDNLHIESLGQNKFKAHSIVDDQIIATAYYTNALNETGWTILQIKTSGNFTDNKQLFYAGYLEGFVTYDLINYAYSNFLNTVLNGQQISAEQQQFITNQTQWIQQQVNDWQQGENGYWGLVGSLMQQLSGLYSGYVDAMTVNNKTNETLTYDQFYYLTNMGDLEDIQNAFLKLNKTEKNCDAYIKLTENDLISAHSTFNIYSLMLRVYKVYDFQFHNTEVQASFQSFSSRPGDLESKDDFYILNNGVVVMETSLNNYNKTNYDYLHYESVPCWMRVNLANRLSSNGTQWVQIFSDNRSGTHNNQWLIVDYNQWKAKSQSNIVWMVEESFAFYEPVDMTQVLLSKGYVAGYNVPYNQEIYNTTLYQQGYGYNYTNDPRSIDFAESSKSDNTTPDVMQVMRTNHNATGDPSNAISPRYDLMNTGPYTYGAIDAKVTNKELLEKLQCYMISSPSYDHLPYFEWKNWVNVPHQGMPAVYDFTWINYDLETQEYSFVDFNLREQQSKILKKKNNNLRYSDN